VETRFALVALMLRLEATGLGIKRIAVRLGCCGTPGRFALCRMARHCLHGRSWWVGEPGDGTAVCALSAEHLMPYADGLCATRVVEEPADGTLKARSTKIKELAVANSLELMARPAGFEPTTPWFVAR